MAVTSNITCANIVSTGSWTGWTTANLNTDDNNRATCATTAYTSGVIRGFDFSEIPAGAAINGIEVGVKFSTSSTKNTASIQTYLSKNAGVAYTAGSTVKTNATTTDVENIMGSTSDLWGTTWSVAELQDTSNFYVRVDGKGSNASYTTRVTLVWVRVTYTAAPTPNKSDTVTASENTKQYQDTVNTRDRVSVSAPYLPPLAVSVYESVFINENLNNESFDNFDDTNGTLLENHTSDSGDAWVKHGSYSSGSLKIDSANSAIITNNGATQAVYYYNNAPPSADYTVFVGLKDRSGSTSQYDNIGVLARVSSSANTYYAAVIEHDSFGFTDAYLYKVVDGSKSTIGNWAAVNINSISRLGIRVKGNKIAVILQDSFVPQNEEETTYFELGEVTDSDISAAGYAGVLNDIDNSTTNEFINKFWIYTDVPYAQLVYPPVTINTFDGAYVSDLSTPTARDTFTDTNNTLLENHTADSGQSWVKHSSYSSGSLKIDGTNNYLVTNSGTTPSLYYINETPNNANYTVSAKLTPLDTYSGDRGVGVVARVNSSANTYYEAVYEYVMMLAVVGLLYKVVDGVRTQLAEIDVTDIREIGLSVNGNQITFFAKSIDRSEDGETDFSYTISQTVTDNDITEAGYAGVVNGLDAGSSQITEFNLYQNDTIQVEEAATADKNVNKSDQVNVTENKVVTVSAPQITTTDTITSVTDTPVSFIGINLPISDTVTSTTESVAVTLSAPQITTSDTVTSVTESKSVTISASQVAVSETVTSVTDTPTAKIGVALSVFDTVSSVTESVSAKLTAPQVTTSDTISSVTEAVAATLTAPRVSVSDTINTSENVVVVNPTCYVSTSNTVNVTEAVASQLSAPQITLSDTVTTSESQSAVIRLNLTTSDTVTSGENTVVVVVTKVSASETATLSEAFSVTVSGPVIATSESVTLTEFVSLEVSGLPITVSETLTPTENVVTVISSSQISVSDTTTLTEQTNQAVSAPVASTSETITTTEAVATFVSSPQVISTETINTSENRGATLSAPQISVSDTTTLSESTNRLLTLSVAKFESVTVTDIPWYYDDQVDIYEQPVVSIEGATIVWSVNKSDTVTTSEAVQVRLPFLNVAQTQSVNTSESVTVRLTALAVVTSDTVTATDTPVARVSDLGVSTSQIVTTSEAALSLISTPSVTVSETVNTSELVLVSPRITITQAESVTVSESSSARILTLAVTTSDTTNTSDTCQVSLANLRISQSESITATELANATVYPIKVSVSDPVTVSEDEVVSVLGIDIIAISVSDTITTTENSVVYVPTGTISHLEFELVTPEEAVKSDILVEVKTRHYGVTLG